MNCIHVENRVKIFVLQNVAAIKEIVTRDKTWNFSEKNTCHSTGTIEGFLLCSFTTLLGRWCKKGRAEEIGKRGIFLSKVQRKWQRNLHPKRGQHNKKFNGGKKMRGKKLEAWKKDQNVWIFFLSRRCSSHVFQLSWGRLTFHEIF